MILAMFAAEVLRQAFEWISDASVELYRVVQEDAVNRKALNCFYQLSEEPRTRVLKDRADQAWQAGSGNLSRTV